ncbi:hypothetical protein BJX70DRAFT_218368 [Aspergillus crustosus]
MIGKRKRINTTATTAAAKRKTKPPISNPGREILSSNSPDLNPQSQSQSQFPFFRLPPELRTIIYTHIFTFSTTIHIAFVGGRTRKFRSFLCKVPEAEQFEKSWNGEQCRKCKINHQGCSPRKPNSKDVLCVPTKMERRQARAGAFLRSCRRVYNETITMLYKSNTFYIENPRTLLELPNFTSLFHLSLFRHLYLESPLYGDHVPIERIVRWGQVIDALTKLDGLETLTIIIRPIFGLRDEIYTLENPIDEAQAEGRLNAKPVVLVNRLVRMAPASAAQDQCPYHRNINGSG